MEFTVQPRAFNVLEVPGTEEDQPVTAQIQLLDAGGTLVRVIFMAEDWENFQKAVADPAGFAASMEARSKIVTPGAGNMATSIKEHKH